MGGRHASCDIGPRHHNHVSFTLPDFGRSRAKSGGVLQGQECQYLHPLSLSAPSMITYSCTPCWLLGDQADREHSSSNHWSSGECRLYSNAPGGYRNEAMTGLALLNKSGHKFRLSLAIAVASFLWTITLQTRAVPEDDVFQQAVNYVFTVKIDKTTVDYGFKSAHISLPGNIDQIKRALQLIFAEYCKADKPKSPF